MSNLPAGSLFILPASVTGRGYTPRVESCEVCNAEVELDRDCGKWYFVGCLLRECVPTWVGKAFLCSARCQSQHYYNLGTDQDRELLNALARMCHAWQEEGINPDSHDWCLQHLHSGLAVTRFTLRTLSQGVDELIRDLAGQDYLDGHENAPDWYGAAIAPAALTLEPLDVLALKEGLSL